MSLDLEKRLKNMNLAELDSAEAKKSEKPKASYNLNISNFEKNKRAKESTIYFVLNKVKLQNELKENYKLSIDNTKRPYNFNFSKDYVFLPLGELSYIIGLGFLTYRNKITLNSVGVLSCTFAIFNELARNYFFHQNFKDEYEKYLETKRNYNKIVNSFISEITLRKIVYHYFKNEHINLRDEKILSLIKPVREKFYQKEAFQELMYIYQILIK